MSADVRDVIIIGSGPAGYTAGLYAARAQLQPLLFEGAVTAGGALMNTTEVENYPGFPDAIMGPDLMAKMRSQAEKFGTELVTDDVCSVDLAEHIKLVTDSAGTTFRARAVILATGSAVRKLGVVGEDALSGHGVSYCATCDGFFFRGQHIVVVGGGDSAMEEATFLTRFASKVTIVHRRDEFRASKVMAMRALENPKIDVAWDSVVTGLEESGGKLCGVRITNVKTQAETILEATGLFVAIGHDPRSELFTGQIETDDEGYVLTSPTSTATNLDGVFACGDVVDHTYRQAVTAAGSGCAAALDAERWLASFE